ncbi:MAG TPA: PilZ domain-containing protein [Sphingobium sp.]|nr:PilZ domain-containing protein [Sphingobium sp.]
MSEPSRQADQSPHASRRQVARDLVDFESALILNGGVEVIVRLVDLSRKGFHARCANPRFIRDDVVTVCLPLVGFLPGRVMWGLKGCFGAQFSVPLDERTYLRVLTRIRAETREGPASSAG